MKGKHIRKKYVTLLISCILCMTMIFTASITVGYGAEASVDSDGTVVSTLESILDKETNKWVLQGSVDKAYIDYLISEEKEHDYGALRWYFWAGSNTEISRIKISKEILRQLVSETGVPLELSTILGTVSMDNSVLNVLLQKTKGNSVDVIMEKIDLTTKQKEIYGNDAEGMAVYFYSNGKKITDLDFSRLKVILTPGDDLRKVGNLDVGRITSKGKMVSVENSTGGQVGNLRTMIQSRYLGTFILTSKARVTYGKKVTCVQSTTIKASAKSISHGATLTWKKSAGFKMDGYHVYVSAKKSSDFKKVFTTKKQAYTHTGAKRGSKQYYKIRGYRKINGTTFYTKWSPVVSATAR